MNELILNFINGNLTTAKKQAKKHKLIDIRTELIDYYYYSFEKAQVTAEYLKNKGSFSKIISTE